MHCEAVRGGGAEREQWRQLHSPQDFRLSLRYPLEYSGPLWYWFPSGWACACSRPLWVSPTTSPVRLGVSPAAALTPRGAFNQSVVWVARSASLPALGLVYLWWNVGPQGASRCSAFPVLRHFESGPLGLSVRECGATGFASAWTACVVGPTLRQSGSCHSHESPLHPGAHLCLSYRSG